MNEFQIPPERDLPRGQLERRSRHLVSELTSTRRRRRLLLSLVPAVAILLTAATGFTAYVLQRTEPTHLESIGCYERAADDANVAVISTDGRNPVAQCRDLWEEGSMGSPIPRRLAACVLATGPIGVFPSADDRTCERMGLSDLSTQGEAERRRFVRMRNAVYSQIGTPASGNSRGSSQCVGEAWAHSIVRQVLDAHGYSDWKVATAGEGFSRERPCADVSFDGGDRTALLLASERKGP
jgi:hypothetical protein